jgi:hypothetical protein
MTSVIVRAVVFAMMVLGWTGGASAQGTSWPDFQQSLKSGESTSPVKASVQSPRTIKTPGPEVPGAIRGLSGRWIGWVNKNRVQSIAIDVEELTATGGTVAYAFASAQTPTPYNDRFQVALKRGNELEGAFGSDPNSKTWLQMRLRPDGNADVMVSHVSPTWFVSGIMTRQ